MELREMRISDAEAAASVWNDCAARGETLYKPLDTEGFADKFLRHESYDKELCLVCVQGGRVAGFILGCRKHVFLPRENELNTPGYLTTLIVSPEFRRRGAGGALLSALESALKAFGKTRIDVSSLNPVNLNWLIPGTPGHEHNNMPGMDEDSAAWDFFEKRGYRPLVHEVSMYIDLSRYEKSALVEQKRDELRREGIVAGLYDASENCEWDGMCNRVGSEYWRKVLADETASNSPRPILAARTNGHIVGFTGPADVEKSGRGWFTGICTDPLYEKRGIATVLFNDLMGQFVKLGAGYTSLFTGTENHAQRLYLKTGFRPVRHFAMLRKEL